MKFILYFLNYLFIIFHTLLIIFNCFGWIFKKTRLLNLITLSLTAFSWFILGIWYGWGFCFCTEWHWNVRSKLGLKNYSYSYIHFLIKEITGLDIKPSLVDKLTLSIFIISFITSIIVNYIDFKKSLKKY